MAIELDVKSDRACGQDRLHGGRGTRRARMPVAVVSIVQTQGIARAKLVAASPACRGASGTHRAIQTGVFVERSPNCRKAPDA